MLSNYDTIATPIHNANPFKSAAINANISFSNLESSDSKKAAQSRVLMRAAKSITKTKSSNGSFILKTTIYKSPVKAKINDELSQTIDSPLKHAEAVKRGAMAELSPISDNTSCQKSFIAM